MKRITKTVVASLVCSAVLAGCARHDGSGEAAHDGNVDLAQPDTIVVSKGSITPTISTRTDIAQQASFVVILPERGSFESNVKPAQNIKAGDVIGWNNGHELKSSLDAKVVSVIPGDEDLPKNYAVIEMQYNGFGMMTSAKPLLKNADIQHLKGKFQVVGGVGPTECEHVVLASAGLPGEIGAVRDGWTDGEAESQDGDNPLQTAIGDGATDDSMVEDEGASSGHPQASLDQVICIISKDVEVAAGQQANLVIAGTRREDVVAIPVSAVAGRISNGKVAKVVDGSLEEVAVGLGVTDGAQIEITEGLKEGDEISIVPPDIDPRRN